MSEEKVMGMETDIFGNLERQVYDDAGHLERYPSFGLHDLFWRGGVLGHILCLLGMGQYDEQ
jgi:hypothetical protein